MDDVTFRPGPPRLLQFDPETVDRFRELGRQGASYRVCGEALCVSKDTVSNFLHRHSKAMEVYKAALGEYRAKETLARMAKKAAEREKREERNAARAERAARAGKPQPGEICPACGQRAGEAAQTITLTTAELAEARKQFETLIDRELAARDASEA